MGAVGLNGAAASEGRTVTDTFRIASAGWVKWTPVNAAAIGLHVIGGAGLLVANAARVRIQQGVAASTLAKTVLTGAAPAATAYSRVLGKDSNSPRPTTRPTCRRRQARPPIRTRRGSSWH
ncbi:hypothetical protein [Streptomyces sp. NPDC002690]